MIEAMETERLILRDYVPDDFDDYYRLKNDKETMYYLQDLQLSSMEDAKADFANVLLDMKSEDRKFYFFHVELKETHEQVGSIGYTLISNTPVGKIVHAGYFIYPKFWGKEYTTEAFTKVLEFAFTKNEVYRVTTGCLTENIASEKVMIKCGLIKEAEHIDWEWHDGRMKNRAEYRLLRHEWKGEKGIIKSTKI